MSQKLAIAALWIVIALQAAAGGPDASLYSAILTAHVRDGSVDYEGLASDERFGQYLAQLAATNPESLSSETEQFAFWLNAYNAYTLKLIVDRRPSHSINELGSGGLVLGNALKTTAWDIRFAQVGKRTYTLNEIEHEIIRRRYSDFRAHFALNCASGSCPVLRTEAYVPSQLDEQLDDQARKFLGDPSRNRFDLRTKTAFLSSLFSWYRKDFGKGAYAPLLSAARFAPEEIRRAIEADPSAWKVQFLDYDWSLNAVKK